MNSTILIAAALGLGAVVLLRPKPAPPPPPPPQRSDSGKHSLSRGAGGLVEGIIRLFGG